MTQKFYIFQDCGCNVEHQAIRYMERKTCPEHGTKILHGIIVCDCGKEQVINHRAIGCIKRCTECAIKVRKQQTAAARPPIITMFECGCELIKKETCETHNCKIVIDRMRKCRNCGTKFSINGRGIQGFWRCPDCRVERNMKADAEFGALQPSQYIDCKWYLKCLDKACIKDKRVSCVNCKRYISQSMEIMDYV